MKISFDNNLITDNNLTIEVFNSQNLMLNEQNTFNSVKISLENVPEHTKQAFISIEDKNFYNHNGISVKRMAKAFINNLKSMKIIEGASTISQQLIKNTHLTNEKTLTRKLNEISLTMELERNFSKDEILENYLNIIYFGSNCYGLENASQYYFSKNAKDLNIAESAMLAGMIKSPNYYSPIRQYERCLFRRNVVLEEMKNDGAISESECTAEKNKELEININETRKNKLNTYSQSAIDEAMLILKMPEKQIAIGGYKIYTYQNLDNQLIIEKLAESYKDSLVDNDFAFIDINPENGGVLSYLGKSNYKILEYKRQPGSAIKPLLVYGPAINEDIISPATLILDEPISIEGYEPKNIGDKYYGYISAREALANSLNSSTIKIASYLGLDKIKKYANSFEIELDENDNSYSLTLGGMTYGTNLKQLAGGYTAFANKGKFSSPKFVHYITTKDGKVIYKNNEEKRNIFREDSAYLTTDMLKSCVQNGTARKLRTLPFEVASKTGTAGTKKGNTDAYNIAYTTENVTGVWIGNMDNKIIDIAGGNLPTLINRDYFESIYKNKTPGNFVQPSSIEELEIDLNEYENNHNIVIANPLTLERYIKREKFSRFNLPKESNENFNAHPANLTGYIKNNKVFLSFNANNFLTYEIYKQNGTDNKLIKTISGQGGVINIENDIKDKEKISYYIITKLVLGEKVINEEKSNVLTLYNSSNPLMKIKEKWYL
ncbi:MAG: transglycosylase domain-containing protein [Clostridia bacterium]|nr:transglycosylase domain-containing protein [Clostridia bacterium]